MSVDTLSKETNSIPKDPGNPTVCLEGESGGRSDGMDLVAVLFRFLFVGNLERSAI